MSEEVVKVFGFLATEVCVVLMIVFGLMGETSLMLIFGALAICI